MSYRISAKASEDIEGIWLYTFENWSREQADRYVDLIIDEIEYIAENPQSGRDYGQLRKNYRCSKVKSHLIFFRFNERDGEVEIIRILHQKMDLENRLSE